VPLTKNLIVFALFLLASPAFADTLYGLSTADGTGRVYTINSTTGVATPLVTLTGDPGGTFLVDVDFLSGTLYATDVFSGMGAEFGTINLTTGAFTPINNQGGGTNWFGLAANPAADLFYAADDDSSPASLVSVTPSGTITQIGDMGVVMDDLAYDSNHGILYGVSSSALYTINTSTGAATLVGSLGFTNGDLGLGYDGLNDTLYLNIGGTTHSLYTVNTATGSATLVGNNGSTVIIDGLADLNVTPAVPEPAGAALLAAGLLVIALISRRRAFFVHNSSLEK
jgi:hypothetical protein